MFKRVLVVAAIVLASWVLALAALTVAGPFVFIIGDSERLVDCSEDVDVPDGNGTVIRIPSGLRPKPTR